MPEKNLIESSDKVIALCKERKKLKLTWNELAEKCFKDLNIEMTGENLRQTYVRYKRKNGEFEKLKKDKIQERVVKFKKEKIKFQDEKNEVARQLRKIARFDSLKEYIGKAASKISKMKPILSDGNHLIPIANSDKEGVLLISDWHSDEEIDNFINKFNKDEFLKRIDKLIHKTIEHGKFHDISTLHVVNMNDLVGGIIHLLIRISANEDIISQIMFVSELISEMLVKFSKHFNKVIFYNVIDNHSRVHPDKKQNKNKENFSRFIPWFLNIRVESIKNILIDFDSITDDEFAYFKVCNSDCLAVHGDKDKPESVIKTLPNLVKKNIEYIFMAHYHHNIENESNKIEVIVNQSLVGSDDYCKNHRMSSKPSQKFMVFDHEIGRLATYNIRVDV